MDVVYAIDTTQVVMPGGNTELVRKGEHWSASDPVVRQAPGLFSADPRYGMRYTDEPSGFGDAPVEQATAAPGEKRNVRR